MHMWIGTLENYYGSIEVCKKNGKYSWILGDYSGKNEEEIPEYLYDALVKFEQERVK
ncbi:hypothetical protein D3C86_1802170 [compost metagenome]